MKQNHTRERDDHPMNSRGKKPRPSWLIALVLLTLVASSYVATAATITVDAAALDEAGAVGGAGVDAKCSLREAISSVNNAADSGDCIANITNPYGTTDTIILPAGTITITGASGENANASGDFDISKAVTITGAGQTTTIINGNGVDRLFDVRANVAVTFDKLTIQNGYTTGNGGGINSIVTLTLPLTLTNATVSGNTADTNNGGIFAGGDITLTNSTVSGNTATTGSVGGINSQGAMTLTNSTVSGNTAKISTGGILAVGALALTNSTVSGNTTAGNTGGIIAFSTLKLTNSTVSGNEAGKLYGGIYANGDLALTNSTVSGNKARDSVGGIFAYNGFTATNATIYGNSAGTAGGVSTGIGAATITNSIIANNTGGDCGNFSATWNVGDWNIDSNGSCAALDGGANNITVGAFALPALANNGGTTLTHLPGAGSPAIDAGNNTVCAAVPVNNVDQIGTARPQGTTCDIGAVEVPYYALTVTVSGTGTVTGGTGINCPGVCTENHASGTAVTLTATAGAGQGFSGWGGACAAAGTATTCTVTMSAAQTVSASFGGLGCTDPAATNYIPTATIDDGSCAYAGKKKRNKAPIYDPDGDGRHNGDEDWLVFPSASAHENANVVFIWKALTDPEGSEVTYQLYVCKDGDFENCTPTHVTHSARYAGALGAAGALALVIGLGFTRSGRRRSMAFLLAAVLMTSSAGLVACGGSDSDSDSTESTTPLTCNDAGDDEVCKTSLSLDAGDYQWMVIAEDSNGKQMASGTRDLTVE